MGAAIVMLALVYTPVLLSRFDPDPPLSEFMVSNIKWVQARLAVLGAALMLLSVALERSRAAAWTLRSGRARALGLTVLAAGVAGVVCELVLSPIARRYTTIFMRDRQLGWRLRPGAQDYWGDVLVHINSKGLRGPELDYARRPGTTRLLYLGDSVWSAPAERSGDGALASARWVSQSDEGLGMQTRADRERTHTTRQH